MADQAPISGNYSDGQQPEGVVGSVTEFGNDIATLAELQGRLVLFDLKECTRSATIPAAVLGAGAALLLGAVPVALAGAGLLLATALNIAVGIEKRITTKRKKKEKRKSKEKRKEKCREQRNEKEEKKDEKKK